jgi:ribosomal protein L7/L12
MPSTVNFTRSDAIDAIRAFHCLPKNAKITIEGFGAHSVFAKVFDIVVEEGELFGDNPKKIPAIKTLRNLTGLGLKEAKMMVDAIGVAHDQGDNYDSIRDGFEDVLGNNVDENDIIREASKTVYTL